MKQPDKAAPTLIAGLGIGVALVSIGFYIAAIAVALVAWWVAAGHWSVVVDSEAEASAYGLCYNTERLWIDIRKGRVKVEDGNVILNMTSDEFVNHVVELWKDAGFYKIANEREHHYMQGAGFVVESKAGQDVNGEEIDEVRYNYIEL